jgi:hypothetical protein
MKPVAREQNLCTHFKNTLYIDIAEFKQIK